VFFVPSSRRLVSSARRAAVAGLASLVWIALPAASLAAVPPAYSNVPSHLPGNVTSFAFEAQSAAEFGDLVALGGTERDSGNLPVTVVMSIWACEQGGDATCVTTPGSTWTHPITLNIYAVDNSGATPAPGAKLLSVTQTFTLPYRPSWDSAHCTSSYGWYQASAGRCYNGLAHPITFALPGGTPLPDQLIWTVAFNTTNHGYHPIGKQPGTAPYDSLNVGSQTLVSPPAYGADVDPDVAFVAGDTGGLHADSGWAAYTPLACIGATCAIRAPGEPDPTAAPTESASPSASETVAGATGLPRPATTLPPTSTDGDPEGGATVPFAFGLCLAFGTLGAVTGMARRRALGRG